MSIPPRPVVAGATIARSVRRDDPKQIVGRGYDAVALRYAAWAGTVDSPAMSWIRELVDLLPPGSEVLELGCGRGVPATRELAKRHRVVGVDISSAQVELARHHVPEATFVHADALELELPPASYDAVVSLYMLGHVPPGEQPVLVERIAAWLRPGGLLLTTMGAGERDEPESVEDDWLGAPMYFAGVGESTSRAALEAAGLGVLRSETVGQLEHGQEARFLWVLARKPA
jgi:cyclopropane fatty-acyl-phospholipid synthase-like methyltransferase